MAREELTQQVRDGQLDGFLEVPKDILNGKEATLHTRNASDFQTTRAIGRAVNNAVIERRLSDRGVHIDNLSEVMRGVELTLVKVTKTGESEENGQSLLVQVSIVMILYITLLVYGVMTMRSVLEEKTTRIVEILASSIKPSHLLTGKILGVAGVGLTQYLIWVCTAALVSAYGAAVGSAFWPGAAAPKLPSAHLVSGLSAHLLSRRIFPLCLALCGLRFHGVQRGRFAAGADACHPGPRCLFYSLSRHSARAQLAAGGDLDHDSFFQPHPDGLSDHGANPALLANRPLPCHLRGDNCGVIQVSAKIYRVGILMYGKRPSLVELLRWLRYT